MFTGTTIHIQAQLINLDSPIYSPHSNTNMTATMISTANIRILPVLPLLILIITRKESADLHQAGFGESYLTCLPLMEVVQLKHN